jgi:hypothetical protein
VVVALALAPVEAALMRLGRETLRVDTALLVCRPDPLLVQAALLRGPDPMAMEAWAAECTMAPHQRVAVLRHPEMGVREEDLPGTALALAVPLAVPLASMLALSAMPHQTPCYSRWSSRP